MDQKELYNSTYSFAKQKDIRNKRILRIMSVVFLVLIIGALLYSGISSLDFFRTKDEVVSNVFDQDAINRRIESDKQKAQKYKDANIPYRDPQNRFSIEFLTPYVSDRITVVINSDKDYDKVKKEADRIVDQARSKVTISTVTYVNSF